MRPAVRSGRRAVARWTVLLSAAWVVVPVTAHAQLLGQYYPSGIPGYQTWFSDAVQDRPHSEYASAGGVQVGSFVIRPSLAESLSYNSNVFGSANPASDVIIGTQGSVGVSSDWSRNSLDATVSFNNQRYLRYTALSHTDWTAGLGGTVQIGNDQLTWGYSHVVATSPSFQIGILNSGRPVIQTYDDARMNYQMTFGRFTVEPALDVGIGRFASVASGGANEATNNINSFAGSLTTSYRLAPGSSLVLVANGATVQYPIRTRGLPSENYNDVSLVGGVDFHAGALLRFRLTVGGEQRTYVSTQLPATSAPLVEFDVIWTPTQLTTISGQVSHSLQNAITPGAAESYTSTDAHLTVDHELRRNVLLQAFGQLQDADYQTHGGTQRVVSAGAQVTWLLNRELNVVGNFTYTQNNSSLDGSSRQSASLAELTLNLHL